MASSTINRERTAVRGIGENALRVNNLYVMQKFYEEVIGLPLMARVPDCAFFRLRTATAVTHKSLPYSTAPGSPVIVGRTRQLPPSITSHSRWLSLNLRTNGRDWRH